MNLRVNMVIEGLSSTELMLNWSSDVDYTVEDDGKKQLVKLAGELNISLQEKDIQRVQRLGKKKRSKAANPRGIIARSVSYAKQQEFIEKRKNWKAPKLQSVKI